MGTPTFLLLWKWGSRIRLIAHTTKSPWLLSILLAMKTILVPTAPKEPDSSSIRILSLSWTLKRSLSWQGTTLWWLCHSMWIMMVEWTSLCKKRVMAKEALTRSLLFTTICSPIVSSSRVRCILRTRSMKDTVPSLVEPLSGISLPLSMIKSISELTHSYLNAASKVWFYHMFTTESVEAMGTSKALMLPIRIRAPASRWKCLHPSFQIVRCIYWHQRVKQIWLSGPSSFLSRLMKFWQCSQFAHLFSYLLLVSSS